MGGYLFFFVGLAGHMEGLGVLVQAVAGFMCGDCGVGWFFAFWFLFIGTVGVVALNVLRFDYLSDALVMPGLMMTQALVFFGFFHFLRAIRFALPGPAKIRIQLFIALLQRLDICLRIFEQLHFFFLNLFDLHFKRIRINLELLFNLPYKMLTPIFLRF